MHREGFDIARCTVARLMKDIGIEGAIRGKRPGTTIPDKALPCPLDRVNRQFHASAPNVLWVSDFTYVATWQGFVYVAFIIDVFARRIVGWRASRIANAGFGTGHSSKQASTRSTSASLRSRIAISVDQIHRTTGRGEDCTVSRQRRGFL
jgi:transposase InsO family protein